MQTAQINTVKAHLAISQNDFSALGYRSSRLILLSASHSEMTWHELLQIFWQTSFGVQTLSAGQRVLGVPVDSTNTFLSGHTPLYVHPAISVCLSPVRQEMHTNRRAYSKPNCRSELTGVLIRCLRAALEHLGTVMVEYRLEEEQQGLFIDVWINTQMDRVCGLTWLCIMGLCLYPITSEE